MFPFFFFLTGFLGIRFVASSRKVVNIDVADEIISTNALNFKPSFGV